MGKVPEYDLERDPVGPYRDFIKNATKNFLDNFEHGFKHRKSNISGKRTWVIGSKNIVNLKNIFIETLQQEFIRYDLLKINSEANEAIAKLKEIVDGAKEDLEYISEAVVKKVDEEIKYG